MKLLYAIFCLVLGLLIYTLVSAWNPNPVSIVMPEICNNAIDDDLDGLIDLNDPDCICGGMFTDSLGHFIRDPSFEDKVSCPEGPDGLRLFRRWAFMDGSLNDSIYASPHDTCGYIGDSVYGYSPQPYPDGSSCLALTGTPSRKEYVMKFLETPLRVDSSYKLRFNLGFGEAGASFSSNSSVTLAIYGRESGVGSPYNYSGQCPDGVDGWRFLDSVTVQYQQDIWVVDSFLFTNNTGIELNQIMLGYSCKKLNSNKIYYIDNLLLSYSKPIDLGCRHNLIVFSRFCAWGVLEYWLYFDNLHYCNTFPYDFDNLQWYRDGIAFNVSHPLKLYFTELDSIIGHKFHLAYINDNGCALSNELYFDPEIYERTDTAFFSEKLCPGEDIIAFDSIITEPGIYQFKDCGRPYHITVLADTTAYNYLVDTTCISTPYLFQGNEIDSPGLYTFYVERRNQCDSVVELKLVVIDTSREMISTQICSGQNYESGGQVFTTTGNYRIHLDAQNGCDSLVLLDLLVIDTLRENIIAEICAGENYTTGGQVFTETGNYQIPLQAIGGCDSLINLDLTVLDSTLENRVIKICEGEDYELGGQVFTETGMYAVRLQRVNTCDSTIVLDLEVSDGVQGDILILDSISCYDRSDARVEIILENNDPVSILWNTGDTTRILENLDPGIYTVDITDDVNCRNTVSVEIPEPEPLQSSFIKSDIDCLDNSEGGSVIINTASGGTSPYSYFLNDEEISTISETITGLDTGEYVLTVLDRNGCQLDADFRIEDLRPGGSIELLVSNDVALNGEVIELEIVINNIAEPYTVQWTGNNLFCDTCLITTAQVREGENNYSAIVTDALGCTYEVSTQITVNSSIYIPNAFTPNDDGRNDYFTLYADASIQRIEYMRIFNRLGDLIYHIADIPPNEESLGWDGKFQGLIQNPGVYVYVISYVDGVGLNHVVNGDVTLLR